jgi:hypothetical protein
MALIIVILDLVEYLVNTIVLVKVNDQKLHWLRCAPMVTDSQGTQYPGEAPMVVDPEPVPK